MARQTTGKRTEKQGQTPFYGRTRRRATTVAERRRSRRTREPAWLAKMPRRGS